MKKAALAILWLILSLILPACGTTSYAEMEAEAEITGDNTKLEAFDVQADKAAMFFAHKRQCMSTNGLIWFCKRGHASTRHRKPASIEQLVRDYRREKASGCGCGTMQSPF